MQDNWRRETMTCSTVSPEKFLALMSQPISIRGSMHCGDLTQ